MTGLPPAKFRAGLGALRPPPSDVLRDWRVWWVEARPRLTAPLHGQLVARFDKLRLYAVAELPAPPRAADGFWSVAACDWKDDGDYLAGYEAAWAAAAACLSKGGGLWLATLRDRAAADELRAALKTRIPAEARRYIRRGFAVEKHAVEVLE